MKTFLAWVLLLGLFGFYAYDKGYFTAHEEKLYATWVMDKNRFVDAFIRKLNLPADSARKLKANNKLMAELHDQALNFKIQVDKKKIRFFSLKRPSYNSEYTILFADKSKVTVEYYDAYLEETTRLNFNFDPQVKKNHSRMTLQHDILKQFDIEGPMVFNKAN